MTNISQLFDRQVQLNDAVALLETHFNGTFFTTPQIQAQWLKLPLDLRTDAMRAYTGLQEERIELLQTYRREQN